MFAAAVVLDPHRPIRGLDDSKLLEPERREVLAARIEERARAWAVGAADAFEIDRFNILEASRLAMRRAVERIAGQCDHLLIDAIRINVALPQLPLIRGDSRSFSIAAASILAKVARDRALGAWDQVFPEYCLGKNKGYGTADHLAALDQFGPTSLHRFSFEPVRQRHLRQKGLAPWTGYAAAVPAAKKNKPNSVSYLHVSEPPATLRARCPKF